MEEEKYRQSHNFEETYTVFLNKVPSSISEPSALASVCLKITGIKPIDCFKYQPEQNDNKCASWGILEFSNKSQAESSILKLNNNHIFNFDACMRENRQCNDHPRVGNGQQHKFVDVKSLNLKESAEQDPRSDAESALHKQIGRGCKLSACGVATSSPDLRHFAGPVFDASNVGTDNSFDRNTPVDCFGDYVGCYYEPLNSVTRRQMQSERKAAELRVKEVDIDQSRSGKTGCMNFNNQSISVNISSNRNASAKELLRADEGFKECLTCSRVTSIVCYQCGKPFCSLECVSASDEHVNGSCQGNFTAPLHLKNKTATLKSGIGNSLVLVQNDAGSKEQPSSDDGAQLQSVFTNNACSIDKANYRSIPKVLPKHVGQSGNAQHMAALVQLGEVESKKQSDSNLICRDPCAGPGKNDSLVAVNENACKQQIKSVVSKSRNPKSHVYRRGPNTLNLIEIELSNNLSRLNESSSQTPTYCVPLIRRTSGDQRMVLLYSPQSRQSHSLHDQGLLVPSLLFTTQNKPKKHVRFTDLGLFNGWISATKLGSLFSITVRSIVKEYGEPVAFICTVQPTGAISSSDLVTDQELKSLSFLGTLLLTTVPALDIWMESLKAGCTLQVEFVALEGVKITGHLFSDRLHACKISLELWNPVLEADIPFPVLAAGSEVVISHVCSSNLCYVKLSQRAEHHRLLLDIYHLFQNSDAFVTWPRIGQLVLAQSEVDGQCRRARVKAIISEDKVLVLYIDVGNYEVVSLNGLCFLSKHLQQIPAEAVLVCLSNVEECQMSKQSTTFMEDLAAKGTKLRLDYSSSKKVELKIMETGQSVNLKLIQTLKKSWDMDTPEQFWEKSGNNVQLEEWGTQSFGKMSPIVILNHKDGELTCCEMNNPLFNCVLKFFPELAEEYVDSCCWDKNVPILNQLVLAQSRKDGLWYRALVCDCCSSSVEVVFIDFGDSETEVDYSRVRKLPYEMRNAPILGVQVTVIGANEEVITKFQELLQPGNIVEGIVLSHSDSTLFLVIPSLLKELYLSGLLSQSNVDSIAKMLSLLPEARAATDIVKGLKKEKPTNLLTLCDVNQNIITSFEIPMCILQGLDNTLIELVQDVLQEELMEKTEEKVKQFEAGLKLDYFSSLQNWVISCEDKKVVLCAAEVAEKEAENVQVTADVLAEKPSMLSLLLKSRTGIYRCNDSCNDDEP